jgi:hypothetical protein
LIFLYPRRKSGVDGALFMKTEFGSACRGRTTTKTKLGSARRGRTTTKTDPSMVND